MATWQQDAESYLGAQAPAVVQYLSNIMDLRSERDTRHIQRISRTDRWINERN